MVWTRHRFSSVSILWSKDQNYLQTYFPTASFVLIWPFRILDQLQPNSGLLQNGCRWQIWQGVKVKPHVSVSKGPNRGICISSWATLSTLNCDDGLYVLVTRGWTWVELLWSSGSDGVAETDLSTLASRHWRRKHIGAISHPFMCEITCESTILSLYCEGQSIKLEEPLARLHYLLLLGWASVEFKWVNNIKISWL